MGAELTAERAPVNLIRGAGVNGAGIRTISQLRSRARSKEIHLPSGDQEDSSETCGVRLRICPGCTRKGARITRNAAMGEEHQDTGRIPEAVHAARFVTV